MFFIEIPIAVIIIFALCAVGLGWGIISNIEAILTNIGIGLLGLIIGIIIIVLIFSVCYLVARKNIILTTILLLISLCLLVYGIFTFAHYQYDKYDAFYTNAEITLEGRTSAGETISITIPSGSLVSEVKRNTEIEVYYGGLDSIPKTRECKYIMPDETEIIVEIPKANMSKCGWIDYFGNFHEETQE